MSLYDDPVPADIVCPKCECQGLGSRISLRQGDGSIRCDNCEQRLTHPVFTQLADLWQREGERRKAAAIRNVIGASGASDVHSIVRASTHKQTYPEGMA